MREGATTSDFVEIGNYRGAIVAVVDDLAGVDAERLDRFSRGTGHSDNVESGDGGQLSDLRAQRRAGPPHQQRHLISTSCWLALR